MLLLFAVLLQVSVLLGQQRNELMVRANQFLHYQSDQWIEEDSAALGVSSTSEDRQTSIGLDASYLRKWKEIKLLFRLGYEKSAYQSNGTSPQQQGYITTRLRNGAKAINFGIGMYCPVLASADQKNVVNFSVVGSYGHTFDGEYYAERRYYNEQNLNSTGLNQEINYSDAWRLNLEAGVSFYHYFFQSLGIGIEWNLNVHYIKRNGASQSSQVLLDENLLQVDVMNSTRWENTSSFGKSAPVSIGITYRY